MRTWYTSWNVVSNSGSGLKKGRVFGLEAALRYPSFVSFQSAHIKHVSFPVYFPSFPSWVIIPLSYFVRRFEEPFAPVRNWAVGESITAM